MKAHPNPNRHNPNYTWPCQSARSADDYTHGYCLGWWGSEASKTVCICACHKKPSAPEAGVKQDE